MLLEARHKVKPSVYFLFGVGGGEAGDASESVG